MCVLRSPREADAAGSAPPGLAGPTAVLFGKVAARGPPERGGRYVQRRDRPAPQAGAVLFPFPEGSHLLGTRVQRGAQSTKLGTKTLPPGAFSQGGHRQDRGKGAP